MKAFYFISLTHLTALTFTLFGFTRVFAAPANDNFVNAEALSLGMTTSGTTLDASREAGDPIGSSYGNPISGVRTVWYSWTATSSALVRISGVSDASNRAPFRGYLVYGDTLLNSNLIAQSTVSNAPLDFYAVQGRTYHLCIDDFVPGWVNYHGFPFRIGLSIRSSLPDGTQFVEPLSNDETSQALSFNQAQANFALYVRGATFDPGEYDLLRTIPNSSIGNGNGGVWMVWTAPVSGVATITGKTPSNSKVVLLQGTSDAVNGIVIDAGNSSGALSFYCTKGVVYYLDVVSQDNDCVLFGLSSAGAGSGGVNSLGAQAGTFVGMVGSDGCITLALTGGGAVTGKVTLAGVSYTLRGSLTSGHFSSATGLPVTLDLDLDSSTAVLGDIAITGTINGQAFTAHHAAYKASALAPEAGKYTALLKPATSSATVPQGIGFAALSVKTGKKAGKVAFSLGKLADGTALVGGGVLVGDGAGGKQLIFYNKTIYAKKGYVAGAIAFANGTNSDCSGSLRWFKPNFNTGAYYPQGFDTFVNLIGARYTMPKNAAAVPFSGGMAQAALKDGGLDSAIVKSITLAVTNAVSVNGVNTEGLTIKLTPRTGTFKGAFHHPAKPTVLTKFSGVLFQKTNTPEAAGFYLTPVVEGSGLSGSVDLTP